MTRRQPRLCSGPRSRWASCTHNNLGTLLRDRGALIEAQQEFQRGARRGDALASRNLAGLRSTHRRQLNRAYRRRARERATDLRRWSTHVTFSRLLSPADDR